jgi:hypothetical protein
MRGSEMDSTGSEWVHWLALVSTIMHLCILLKAGNFSTTKVTSSSRDGLLSTDFANYLVIYFLISLCRRFLCPRIHYYVLYLHSVRRTESHKLFKGLWQRGKERLPRDPPRCCDTHAYWASTLRPDNCSSCRTSHFQLVILRSAKHKLEERNTVFSLCCHGNGEADVFLLVMSCDCVWMGDNAYFLLPTLQMLCNSLMIYWWLWLSQTFTLTERLSLNQIAL